MNTNRCNTAMLNSRLDYARDSLPNKTAEVMARHTQQFAPYGTAQLKSQVSHPPVKFVNGFQKRLGVYKTGCRETNMTSDSESDISSLEIDSNLSHSSDLSNHGSPKCSFLPQNDEQLEGNFTTDNNTSGPCADFEGVLVEHHKNTIQPSLCDDIQSDNLFRQNTLNLKSVSQDQDKLCPVLVNKTAPILDRRSSITSSPRKSPNSTRKSQPLVIKIRRRTWTVTEKSQCHESNQNGDTMKARSHSTTEIKQAANLTSNRLDDEWHSIVEERLPGSAQEAGKVFTKQENKTKNIHRLSKKKHHHHKSKKSKLGTAFIPHRKKEDTLHNHKTRRKKSKDSASKNRYKSKSNHNGKILRLPSDPQKAVKVLERALESINAQIKQLKKESVNENQTSRRERLRSARKTSKKKMHKEITRHNSKNSKGLLPTLSLFRFSDSFSVVPSLIVRDGDLHPAYSASVDPGEPPVRSHPIWRWRLGQPPLPKSTLAADRVMDWFNE